jgi:hypothetical protein
MPLSRKAIHLLAIAAFLLCQQAISQPRPSPPSPTPPQSANPKFTKMDIVFHTTNEDKDHDTRLEIFIVRAIGKPALAYLDIGGGNQPHVPNEGFPDNSTSHPFVVPMCPPGFTLNDLPNEEILLKITANGHDTWRFGYDAVLHFDDGTNRKISVPAGSITLRQPGQEWDRNSEVKLSGAR